MKPQLKHILGTAAFAALSFQSYAAAPSATKNLDMLTSWYYYAGTNTSFRNEIDQMVRSCQKSPLHHPLQNKKGHRPKYTVPAQGSFGAGKGFGGTGQHHPAIDLHIGNRETAVEIFAAHDGVVATFRDAPKYRHYISITQPITDHQGTEIGKLVTLYAHVDLDQDEADGLLMDGQTVAAGDLISKNLYEGTRGGPHLHFEIRYYRPGDQGDESFYGFSGSRGNSEFTEPSAEPWKYGVWNPTVGYGYGNPKNHGLNF